MTPGTRHFIFIYIIVETFYGQNVSCKKRKHWFIYWQSRLNK